jgi:C2H2-type zinc finger
LYYDGLRVFDVEVNKKIAEAVYSAMFTYSIYRFSYLYFEKKQNNRREDYMNELEEKYQIGRRLLEERESSLKEERRKFELALSEHEGALMVFKSELENLEQCQKEWVEIKNDIESDIEQLKELRKEFLKCPQCNKPFDSYLSLRGHLKVHSDKYVSQENE